MRFDSRQIAPVKPGLFNEHLSLWRNRASGVPVSALHVRRQVCHWLRSINALTSSASSFPSNLFRSLSRRYG